MATIPYLTSMAYNLNFLNALIDIYKKNIISNSESYF